VLRHVRRRQTRSKFLTQPADKDRTPGTRKTERNEEVLNDRRDLGYGGSARSSGGYDAVAFIRAGMQVINADGKLIGTVMAVEGDKIRLISDEGEPDSWVPLNFIDGVDEQRVILARGDDQMYGLGAEP
jgi:hypothetical protein